MAVNQSILIGSSGLCADCCPSCARYASPLSSVIVTFSGISLCSGTTGTVNGSFTLTRGIGFGQFQNTSAGNVTIGGVSYPTYISFSCGSPYNANNTMELNWFAYNGSPFANAGQIFRCFDTIVPGNAMPNQYVLGSCSPGAVACYGGTGTMTP